LHQAAAEYLALSAVDVGKIEASHIPVARDDDDDDDVYANNNNNNGSYASGRRGACIGSINSIK